MESFAHLEHVSHRMPMEARAALRRAADITAGAESAAAAGDDQHAHVVVLAREVDSRAHVLDHRLVVAVHPLGTVDGDFRDAIARTIDDCLEIHGLCTSYGLLNSHAKLRTIPPVVVLRRAYHQG